MSIDYAKVQLIIDTYKLTNQGTRHNYCPRNKTHPDFTVDDIKREEELFIDLLKLIKIFYKPSFRKGKSSYRLKHDLENYVKGYYVSNTMAIIAFAYLDYTVKFYREGGPNVNILVSFEPDMTQLASYIRTLKQSS